jgi:hypothetical protein
MLVLLIRYLTLLDLAIDGRVFAGGLQNAEDIYQIEIPGDKDRITLDMENIPKPQVLPFSWLQQPSEQPLSVA